MLRSSPRCSLLSGGQCGASRLPKRTRRSTTNAITGICWAAAKVDGPAYKRPDTVCKLRRPYNWRLMMPQPAVVANDQLQLVAHLAARGIIQSQRTMDAMRHVDRGCFVHNLEKPARISQQYVYQDDPLPIGLGQTISAPSMHGICLDLLGPHLNPGASALDVGSGSGYLTACMALLVGASGSVLGVEKHPLLAQQSVKNIHLACPHLEVNSPGAVIQISHDNIYRGEVLKPGQQFAAIHVGAAAAEIPQLLVECLKPGGRMVLPVGPDGETQVLTVVDKSARGVVSLQEIIPVRYVPLTLPEAEPSLPEGGASLPEAE